MEGILIVQQMIQWIEDHKEPHLASQDALRKLIAEHDLWDIWRTSYKEQRKYTWAHI